jgi:two-component system, response regulator PdtaR
MSDSNRTLVVDDEFLISDLFSMQLESMGIEVCGTAASAAEAIAAAKQHHPRLVLMDVRLKGPVDGVEAAAAIHRTVGSQILYITGSREPEVQQRIAQIHPAPILFTPVRFDQLKKAVMEALGQG